MPPFANAARRFAPRLTSARQAWGAAGRLLALFLVVTGARFWLIQRYARPLPFWDQWDGIGACVLRPWLHGAVDWHAMFAPHNEHRIVLTRLLSLGLVAANGQWDNLLEAAVNAGFCGLSAVWLAWTLIRSLGPAFRRRVLLAVAVCFVLPFGWENTLVGFQSQNYFLILFSLMAIRGLGFERPGSSGWWAGWLGSVLACGSMATGFLAAVAVLGLRGWRLAVRRRRPGADDLGTGLWCLGVVAFGWWTRTEVAAHAVLRAESPWLFVVALGRYLAWPLSAWPVLGLFALLPLGALAVVGGRRSQSDRDEPAGVELLLGFGGWALLQEAALAYGRGGGGAPPSSRYMDLLAITALVVLLAWQVLAARARGTVWRGPALAGATLSLALFVWGLGNLTTFDFSLSLPWYSQWLQQAESNLHGYVLTGDFARFLGDKSSYELPYPDARILAALVDDPLLRTVLPAGLRPPLALLPATADPGFVREGFDPAYGSLLVARTWGSYTAQGGAARGAFRARLASPGHPLPYLRFSFSGFLGEPGLRFALEGSPGGAPHDWQPHRALPRGRWREDDLRRPAGQDFFVMAADRSPTGWFAFSEPVEVGFWSRWTGFLLRRGEWIAVAGILLGTGLELAGLAGTRAARRQGRPAAT